MTPWPRHARTTHHGHLHYGARARSRNSRHKRGRGPYGARRQPGWSSQAGRRRASANAQRGRSLSRLLAFFLALTAIGAVTAWAVRPQTGGCHGNIIWAGQLTQEEGDSPAPPAGLMTRADQLAACGGGRLVFLQGAGQGAVQAGAVVSLRIYREPGEAENDPTARQNKVQTLVRRAFVAAQSVRPPGAGRDVVGLLASISAELGQGRNDVWLQTLGLPTVSPANARVLMATDPAQAVASIARWLPPLHGARVHLILAPPAGRQPRFNTVTDSWRRQFMIALLRRADADVVSVAELESTGSPAPHAQPAPVIANLPEATPRMSPPRAGTAYTAKLDSSTLFVPNTAQFLSSDKQVLRRLQPIITGWRHGLFAHVLVVGHCARFGPPGGALLLSQQRATKVARLLRTDGVSIVKSEGVGYMQPLPPDPQSASNRVVIVTAYPGPQFGG